ncbi:MAG: hypothetical protein KKD77_21105 [Gammaproteobacteria bacterium]|nr:hypothetical protein [Gammaproteobacteria bacterium]
MIGKISELVVDLTGIGFCAVTVITRDAGAVSRLELGEEVTLLPTIIKYPRPKTGQRRRTQNKRNKL